MITYWFINQVFMSDISKHSLNSVEESRVKKLEFSRGSQFLPRPLPISSRPLGHLSAPLNKRALNSGLQFKYSLILPAFLFVGTSLHLQLVGGWTSSQPVWCLRPCKLNMPDIWRPLSTALRSYDCHNMELHYGCSFASGRSLQMIICKWPVPPDDHL